MEWPKCQAALLATILRLANSRLGRAVRDCARVIHLAPALLPAGLGLLPGQQANAAEEFRALLQGGSTVDQKAQASQPQGFAGREADSEASN